MCLRIRCNTPFYFHILSIIGNLADYRRCKCLFLITWSKPKSPHACGVRKACLRILVSDSAYSVCNSHPVFITSVLLFLRQDLCFIPGWESRQDLCIFNLNVNTLVKRCVVGESVLSTLITLLSCSLILPFIVLEVFPMQIKSQEHFNM